MNGAEVVAQHILECTEQQQPPVSPQKSLVSCVSTSIIAVEMPCYLQAFSKSLTLSHGWAPAAGM